MSQVGILGKQDEGTQKQNTVVNPFAGQEAPNTKILTHLRIQNENTVENNYCHSLKIDFRQIISDVQHCGQIDNIQRYQLI